MKGFHRFTLCTIRSILLLHLCVGLAKAQAPWKRYQGRQFAFNYPADWTLVGKTAPSATEIEDVAVFSSDKLRSVEVDATNFSTTDAYIQDFRSKLEQDIRKQNANGGLSSVTFPATGIADNGEPSAGRSSWLGFAGTALMKANIVIHPYLGGPIIGSYMTLAAKRVGKMVGGVLTNMPASEMWDFSTNTQNVLNIISQSVSFSADDMATRIAGEWHTPEVTSSTAPNGLQSFILPLRVYQAYFSFLKNGRFSYSVKETANSDVLPWELRVTGRYRFEPTLDGHARLVLSETTYTSSVESQSEISRLVVAGFPGPMPEGEYRLIWNDRSETWELRGNNANVVLSH